MSPPLGPSLTSDCAPCVVIVHEAAVNSAVAGPPQLPSGLSDMAVVAQRMATTEALSNIYCFRDSAVIEHLLAHVPGIHQVLLEALTPIKTKFLDASLVLAPEPRSDEEAPGLVLYVQTKLPRDEARAALDELDEEWWLDAMPRAEGRLTIALDHV